MRLIKRKLSSVSVYSVQFTFTLTQRMHRLFTVFLLIDLLTLVISSEEETIASEVCTQVYKNGTFSGQLTSLTWESDGTMNSLETANLLMIFGGKRGYRIAPWDINVDSMIIRKTARKEEEEKKKDGSGERLFHLNKTLHDELLQLGEPDEENLPIVGYYEINIKEHQRNAGRYVFLYNTKYMIRQINGRTMYPYQNFPVCSAFHGQLEKDVITVASKCVVGHVSKKRLLLKVHPLILFNLAKDPLSEHYLLAPMRLDVDIHNLYIAVEKAKAFNIRNTRSYFPLLAPATGHLRLVHVLKGTPKEEPMFSSRPQGTVNYATGVLYLFDDDRGCVYTVQNWGRMDLLERSADAQMDILLPVHCATYESFFRCSNSAPPHSRSNRCSCGGRGSAVDPSLQPQLQLSLYSLLTVIISATVLVIVFCGVQLFCRRGSRKTSAKKERQKRPKWKMARRRAVKRPVSPRHTKATAAAAAAAVKKLRPSSKTSIFGSGSRAPGSTTSHQVASIVSTLSPS